MHAHPAGGSTGDDDDAFAAMCAEHRARLVAYCRRRLGTVHDGEDAAHEALVRAYRAMSGFDRSSDAWPWLRTIAGRVCTDMQRRAARAAEPGLVDVQAGDDVHEQVVTRLRADIVEDALDRLSPRYRSALLLREYGGWSYEEIARAQGRSLPSVRSILTRGRRRLGAHVESVARTRGQWPLPGALPPLRRLREHARSWREAIERAGHALATSDAASIASRVMLGAPAVASLLSMPDVVPPGVVAAPASVEVLLAELPGTRFKGGGAERPSTPIVPLQTSTTAAATAAATATVDHQKALTRVEASSVLRSETTGVRANGTAEVSRDDDHIWVMADPTSEDGSPMAGTNIPCAYREVTTLACATAVPVLRSLPEW